MPLIRSLAACLVFTAGCAFAPAPDADAEALGVQAQPLTTAATYTYFTCNASGWQPSDGNRLVPLDAQGLDYALTYEVKEPWMLTSGDDCTFVTTNALNGWGTTQVRQGGWIDGPDVTNHNLFVVGSGEVGRFYGEGQFKARYPALGKYRVKVFKARAAFTIEPVTGSAIETTITGQRSPFPYMAVYSFSSNVNNATFECACDVGGLSPWRSCSSDDINTASCGSPAGWTFFVRAKDAAGKVDATPASAR